MNDRRTFLKSLAAGSVLTAASARRVRGANDRIRIGLIGAGLIGTRHLLDFKEQPDVEIVGISDVYPPRQAEGLALAGGRAEGFSDFRRMLDRADIDGVVVSTPDHWHALMTILACAAGKDVYVEKPLTHAVREGEWMLEAARRHRRVVQIGTQQRSGRHYQRARELVRAGHIGEVRSVRIAAARNITPGFTRPIGEERWSDEAWQLWLGPAPYVPFDPARALYHFRWFSDYSGGQTTNLLAHGLDIVHWIMEDMPTRVAAFGQRRALSGFGDTPDTFEAVFEYPGFLLTWSSRETAAGGFEGLEISGTRGTLAIDRRALRVLPDRAVPADEQIPVFAGGQRPPPPESHPFRTQPVLDEGYEQVRDQFVPHTRDFLDAMRSRRAPVSDLDSGHKVATACHLANIAARVGRVVRWNAASQDVVDDAEASALLTKAYRPPWDQALRAVVPSS